MGAIELWPRGLMAVALASASLLVAAANARAGAWTAVAPVAGEASNPTALFTSAGEAVVLSGPHDRFFTWGANGPVPVDSPAGDLIRATSRPPGGSFGAPQVLSARGATYYVAFGNPDGSVTARWLDEQGLEEATRPAYGQFGPAVTDVPASELSANGPGAEPANGSERADTDDVRVNVDRAGDLLLVWQSLVSSPDGELTAPALWAQWRPAGGAFAPPARIFQAGNQLYFAAALDDQGKAVVAVNADQPGSSNLGVYAIEAPPSGTFGPPRLVSDPGESASTMFYPPSAGPGPFTVSASGDAAIAWYSMRQGGPPGSAWARVAAERSGTWTQARTVGEISTVFGDLPFLSLAWGPSGQLGLNWEDYAAHYFVGIDPSGVPAPVQTIPGKPDGYATGVGFDSLGNAVALPIVSPANDIGYLTASVRPAGGTFGPTQLLGSSSDGTETVTFDGFGDGVASWTGRHEGTLTVFAAYYDATIPSVTQLSLAQVLPRAAADSGHRAGVGLHLRLSKPGLVRVALYRQACRRPARGRGHCRFVWLDRVRHVEMAGRATLPLPGTWVTELDRPVAHQLTVTVVDGPGRVSRSRALVVAPR